MATGLCNPASSPLRLAPPSSRSSPFHAFASLARPFGSPLRITGRRLRLAGAVPGGGGGSPTGGRLLVRCGVAAIGQAEFAEVVQKSEVPVLVEFVADWCGPCRLVSSVIEWASQEYKDRMKVVKIDHDANPQLIEQYKVYGLPTLILFKDGQEVPESRREGVVTKVKLKEYLDSLLDSIAVA